jgi:hypothetical protein
VCTVKLKCEAAANGSSTKISADYAHDAVMTCASFDLNKSQLAVNSSFATNGVTLGASTSVGHPES